MGRSAVALSVLGMLLTASFTAGAVPIVFFGEDLATGRSVPPAGNAAGARSDFLGGLAGSAGTADFEGFDAGDLPPYALDFAASSGAITATLTGASGICDEAANCPAPAAGEFATSGGKWVFTDVALSLAFSAPVAAFGFFGTDIGDEGARLTITATRTAGGDVVFEVPHTVSAGNNVLGDLLFWGGIDPSTTYTAIRFGRIGGSGDFFGFDDLTVADAGQVRIAEPASFALLALALAGLARAALPVIAERSTRPAGAAANVLSCIATYSVDARGRAHASRWRLDAARGQPAPK